MPGSRQARFTLKYPDFPYKMPRVVTRLHRRATCIRANNHKGETHFSACSGNPRMQAPRPSRCRMMRSFPCSMRERAVACAVRHLPCSSSLRFRRISISLALFTPFRDDVPPSVTPSQAHRVRGLSASGQWARRRARGRSRRRGDTSSASRR